MPPRTAYSPGTFCWVDVTAADVAAAAGFYTRIFGWTADGDGGEGYTLLRKDGADVAGLMEGDRPAWSTYISVADADAAAARVADLGGAVHREAFDVGATGRMAVVADPQGAVFVLWQPGDFAGAAVVNEVGAWVWNDVQTTDAAAACAFYAALLGWEIAEVPGSGGAYFSITHEGRRIGGVMPLPPGAPGSAWTAYFGVTSVGATLERIEAAGGRRLMGPMDVPAGRFAAAADPSGAAFGLIEGTFDD